MAEGFFTPSEFEARQILKFAPDALVFINNKIKSAVIVKLENASGVTFSSGITTINIQNNIDPPGSSTATLNVTAPIYKGQHEDYWTAILKDSVRRSPIFLPMMEVRILLKGRFLVNGSPQYYPAFWGFINTVEESYSGGAYTFTLNCVDMLKWWSYQIVAIKPSVFQAASFDAVSVNRLHTIFNQKNIYQIMLNLATTTGFTNFVVPELVGRAINPGTFSNADFGNIYRGAMKYWDTRFGELSTKFRMYGLLGENLLTVNKGVPTYNRNAAVNVYLKSEYDLGHPGGIITDDAKMDRRPVKDNYFTNFMPYFDLAEKIDYGTSEQKTKLEIATEMKNYIYYEFYQDVNGDFIFKPPYYNMKTKYLFPYVVAPADIISYSFAFDPEQIVTMVKVKSGISDVFKNTNFGFYGIHIDYDLLTTYGLRYKEMELFGFTGTKAHRSLAVLHASITNAKASTGNITIAGRPEIKLGYPVYLPHKDAYYYIKSINHSLEYGGNFTTTLGVEAERVKAYDYTQGKAPDFPLAKDYVYRYKVGLSDLLNPNSKNYDKNLAYDLKKEKESDLDLRQNKVGRMVNGIYELSPRDPKGQDSELVPTQTTTPFSDEEGYKLVGGFPFGRTVVISNSNPYPDLVPVDANANPNFNVFADAQPASVEDDVMTVIHKSMASHEGKLGREGAVPAFYDPETAPVAGPSFEEMNPGQGTH